MTGGVKFKIALVSDLHIGADPNWFPPALGSVAGFLYPLRDGVRRNLSATQHWKTPSSHDDMVLRSLASWLYEHQTDFDLVCFTGDIGRTGSVPDYAAVKRVFNPSPGDALPEAPWLDDALNPYLGFLFSEASKHDGPGFVLPGNHDRFSDDDCKPGSTSFENAFFAHLGGSFRYTVERRSVHDEDCQLDLIACDTSLRSESDTEPANAPWMYYAQGTLAHTLDKLCHQTELSIREGGVPIWLMHHPPMLDARKSLFYKLGGWSKLLERAKKLNVQAIIGGHFHKAMFDFHDDTLLFANYSACEASDDVRGIVEAEILIDQRKLQQIRLRSVIYDDLSDDSTYGFTRWNDWTIWSSRK